MAGLQGNLYRESKVQVRNAIWSVVIGSSDGDLLLERWEASKTTSQELEEAMTLLQPPAHSKRTRILQLVVWSQPTCQHLVSQTGFVYKQDHSVTCASAVCFMMYSRSMSCV